MSDRTVHAACRLVFAVLALLIAAVGAPPGHADIADAGAWAALAEPGTVAVMRHATAPGTGDPEGFETGDCTTQRNLDAAGRAQAEAIGAAFRAHGIAVDRVYTSQWCRCRETARLLGVAPVEELPLLNSFFRDHEREPEQTAATRDFLNRLPGDRKVVLVTHQVNISALIGVYPASGEVVVISVGDDRTVSVRGRIRTDRRP